jgi:leukotriene A-4 hydrolase/aminopeptidase
MSRTDPHSYSDLAQGRTTRLELSLAVDFDEKRLRGEATLHLEGAAGGPLDLDTRDLQIESVTDGGGAPLDWELAKPEGFLGSRLRIRLPEGADAVTVRYATSPEASALQWLEPALTAGKKHPYLFSQCQAIHARSMAPLQDTPEARVSYHAEITVSDPLVAVMSAAPGEKREGPSPGLSTFTFEMPQPIPPYLLALAVGNIASRDLGPRTRVYTEPEMLEAAAWEFAEVEGMLEEAEKLFGPYLWDRYDFLVMPPSFPYGGMENPRLTFLTPTLLAGDRSLVGVLAHELAHSWTGNLVTNSNANHFWLNEGFTVWSERRILEALKGPEAVALASALGRHALEEELARFGHDSPMTRLETDLAGVDPDEAYSQVPYEKGCFFLTLLEQTAGREAWDRFIRDYIEQYQFSTLDTAELESFLEGKLPGLIERVGGREWIHGPGLPANCPVFTSESLTRIDELAAGWGQGKRPGAELKDEWSATEWQIYLQKLPRPMSAEDCRWLDETFSFNQSGNSEILCQWLLIAAASSYEPAYPKIREFLGAYGRMKFLKPLFKALHENESTRAMAAELFETHGDSYHPIARGGLERILEG